MKPFTRVIVAVAALLLLLAYAFPLWQYSLDAPQYPEGLGMSIWINKIGGQLNLVNQLNHYIGMKQIDPGSFPELRYMPWIVGAFIVTGLLVAAVGRFPWLVAWVGTFLVFGIVGLGDFYLWLYNFGHQLSPDAPITMPPFTPPIIGPKTLANFVVVTYPDIGGLAAFGTGLLGVVAVLLERRARRRASRPR